MSHRTSMCVPSIPSPGTDATWPSQGTQSSWLSWVAGPLLCTNNTPQSSQSQPSLGLILLRDYRPKGACECGAASGGSLPRIEINTRDWERKPTKNNPLKLREIAVITSYLQHLPAFLFYSVSSAALLARLAAESLRYDNLLEDPGT